MAGYIEYRIANISLKKHLPESVRIYIYIHRIFQPIHSDPENYVVLRFLT